MHHTNDDRTVIIALDLLTVVGEETIREAKNGLMGEPLISEIASDSHRDLTKSSSH